MIGMIEITAQQKLEAFQFRYYQHGMWTPEVGHYYTTTRSDLEMFKIVAEDTTLPDECPHPECDQLSYQFYRDNPEEPFCHGSPHPEPLLIEQVPAFVLDYPGRGDGDMMVFEQDGFAVKGFGDRRLWVPDWILAL